MDKMKNYGSIGPIDICFYITFQEIQSEVYEHDQDYA